MNGREPENWPRWTVALLVLWGLFALALAFTWGTR